MLNRTIVNLKTTLYTFYKMYVHKKGLEYTFKTFFVFDSEIIGYKNYSPRAFNLSSILST